MISAAASVPDPVPLGRASAGANVAQALLDAVRRMGRRPQGRLAIVLHLSQLRPPAPRPHHRRIARAMLQDTALRHDGQVFGMHNGDLVLLCRLDLPATPGRAGAQDPLSLARILGRLLRADAADPDRLVSVWDLYEGADRLLAYATIRLQEGGEPVKREEDPTVRPDRLDALATLIDSTRETDLLQRQTAIILPHPRMQAADRKPGRTAVLQPLFRELTVSLVELEARVSSPGAASSGIASDPYLLRHLAARLDRRLLTLLRQPSGPGFAPPPGERLHVNLSVAGILSDDFARLAASATRPALGVEIAAMDACADPTAFAAARSLLAQAGIPLVLDGLSHLALTLTRPWSLAPDMVKLDWSPDIAVLPSAEAARLDAALLRIGTERLVLQQADSELALHWGLSRGIRRFQGRHADAMLAAARMMSCHLSAGCTLRQCVERASATGGAGRQSCGNHEMLDAAAPTGRSMAGRLLQKAVA